MSFERVSGPAGQARVLQRAGAEHGSHGARRRAVATAAYIQHPAPSSLSAQHIPSAAQQRHPPPGSEGCRARTAAIAQPRAWRGRARSAPPRPPPGPRRPPALPPPPARGGCAPAARGACLAAAAAGQRGRERARRRGGAGHAAQRGRREKGPMRLPARPPARFPRAEGKRRPSAGWDCTVGVAGHGAGGSEARARASSGGARWQWEHWRRPPAASAIWACSGNMSAGSGHKDICHRRQPGCGRRALTSGVHRKGGMGTPDAWADRHGAPGFQIRPLGVGGEERASPRRPRRHGWAVMRREWEVKSGDRAGAHLQAPGRMQRHAVRQGSTDCHSERSGGTIPQHLRSLRSPWRATWRN